MPGPPSTSRLANLREFRDRPLEFLLRLREQHGPVVRVPMSIGELYVVFGPREIQDVVQSSSFGRSSAAMLFAPLFEGSLIVFDGEPWKRHRARAAQLMSGSPLQHLRRHAHESAARLLARFQAGGDDGPVMPVEREMYRYSSDILAAYAVGHPFGVQQTDELVRVWRQCLDAMRVRVSSVYPWPLWCPTATNRKLLTNAEAISNVFLREVDSAIRSAPSGQAPGEPSLLSKLIAISREPGSEMTPREVMEEVRGIYLAGVDNAASTMSWLLYHLACHRDVQDKVRAELEEAGERLGGIEQLGAGQLPYFSAVFTEATRLSPPLWIVDRSAVEEGRVGAYTLPRGANLIMCPYVTHRDPEFWPDPLRFDPGRHDRPAAAGRHPFAYFAFGGGRFKCFGAGLSSMESQVLLAHLLPRYRLELCPWDVAPFREDLIHRPAPLRIRLRSRPVVGRALEASA